MKNWEKCLKVNLKDNLSNGQLTVGTWLTFGNAAVAEIMVSAGFDWIVIDLEHSVISIDQAGDLIRVIDLAGAVPLVRLTSNDACQIKRVMDAGAGGIVVPMVNSRGDAEKAVAATRYEPLGRRGVGLARAQGYGVAFKDYLQWQKDGPVVIVQIEHWAALDNLDDILSVSGVDGFIVGPYDLSCSLGIPGEFDRDEFRSAINRILEAGKQNGCPAGLHIVEPDPSQLQKTIEDGYKFVAYSVDMRMLDVAARNGLMAIRGQRT